MSDDKLLYGEGDLADFARELDRVASPLPQRINADPEEVERGLAKLVLTLIELLRQLMERQALRRVEAGSLSDEEIERLGVTFLKLQERMEELKVTFGLENEELNLNLGPLGDLM
ncbi:MAG: gas vesicle protein K [Oscillochloris sp.]|nr:gas vesicle protein K [Oscillochloris sp.]